LDRVIISTDSQEIASISRSFGAEVTFIRPPELSGDHSAAIDIGEPFDLKIARILALKN
jgi:N-acylneuraminate cytidylyltransferase